MGVFTPDPIAVVVLLIGIVLAVLAAIGFGVALCRDTRAGRSRGGGGVWEPKKTQ